MVLVAALTDDDVKPKSGVGAGTSLDADDPEVVPEKDLGIDAAVEVFCLFRWVVEAYSTGSISVRTGPPTTGSANRGVSTGISSRLLASLLGDGCRVDGGRRLEVLEEER